jgi:hypothetical protein
VIEVNAGSLYDTQGPVFVGEPPPKLEFTNSSGGRIGCSARGNPEPTVEWLGPDNVAVSSIPGIRIVLNNGSIYFPPFEAEVFRQDVHWAVYKCLVANSVGTIVSRETMVRAGKVHRCIIATATKLSRITRLFIHSFCKILQINV